MPRRLLAIGTLMFASAAVANAQGDSTSRRRPTGTIDGLVSDTSLVPLDDVTVSFVGSTLKVVTGANGRFRFIDVPAGTHKLLARKIGREPTIADVEVLANETVAPALMLEPTVRALGAVRVNGRQLPPYLQEFELRRKSGEGQFLTMEQIEARHTLLVSDLMAGMKGIRMVENVAHSARTGVMLGPAN